MVCMCETMVFGQQDGHLQRLGVHGPVAEFAGGSGARMNC